MKGVENVCNNNCKLCDNVVISQSITFTDDTLIVNLPSGNYSNNSIYCIILAQTIPTDTTITAPVVFTIGTDTTQYAFTNCDCTSVLASQVRTRRRYKTRVNTGISTGVFKYVGSCRLPCKAGTVATSLPIATETAT